MADYKQARNHSSTKIILTDMFHPRAAVSKLLKKVAFCFNQRKRKQKLLKIVMIINREQH